jgi:chitinase
MRPFFKTWLTICLLMPLAAHATNREQQLPASFNGHTAKSHSSPVTASNTETEPTPVTAAPKHRGSKVVEHDTQAEAKEPAKKTETAAAAHQDSKKPNSKVATKESKKAATAAAKDSKKGTTTVVADKGSKKGTAKVASKDSKKAAAATVAAHKDSKKGKPAAPTDTVVSRAMDAVGTPYRWGGTNPKKGLDCSGLVKYAFTGVKGANLPRTSNAMAAGHGQKVDRKDLKPGDLLFFNIESRKVDHVAIYLGNDRFVHAPSRGKSVTVDTLKKPYWDSHYVVAKRVTPPVPNGPKSTMRVVQR